MNRMPATIMKVKKVIYIRIKMALSETKNNLENEHQNFGILK